MKIRPETRWILFFLIFFGSASMISSVWFLRERERSRRSFMEREDSLLQTIASLKEDLSETKAKSIELEERLEEMSSTLEHKIHEVESLNTKYLLAFNDKQAMERELFKSRQEKRTLEDKLKQLQTSPFLVKLLTEKQGVDAGVEGLKATIEQSRNELSQITEERNALEGRIEEIQTAKVKIEERLRQEQNKIGAMSTDLEKERISRLSVAESLSENFSRVKREKEVLQTELSRVSQEKIGLEQELDQVRTRLQEINEKRDQLAGQVQEINQVLATRLKEIDQIRTIYEKTIEESQQIARVEKDVVELPPIVVKGTVSKNTAEAALSPPPVPKQGTATLEEVKNGKIVSVNEKFHFVVINLGRDDGVLDGMSFHVYRDGEERGIVRVTEARQKISACDIVKTEPPGPLREGDLVIQ